MAVIAAQTIDWSNPANMPQSQAVSFATAAMFVTPANMQNVVAAPEPSNVLSPDLPPSSITFA